MASVVPYLFHSELSPFPLWTSHPSQLHIFSHPTVLQF